MSDMTPAVKAALGLSPKLGKSRANYSENIPEGPQVLTLVERRLSPAECPFPDLLCRDCKEASRCY